MVATMRWAVLATVVLAVACKGGGAGNASSDSSSGADASAAAAPAQPTLGDAVKPNGTVHTVQLIADTKGARFDPNTINAKPGDVVKFVLASGAHNVHFLPEKNPAGVNLPKASDVLQLPGQSYELLVGAKPGTYNFQCDPHAALGMIGTITVQ